MLVELCLVVCDVRVVLVSVHGTSFKQLWSLDRVYGPGWSCEFDIDERWLSEND